ncbi:MAG: branched-chain amino acid aminotransferase [Alphaproteobacteria bacterium]|nr:branched-chain amino acid aminotransferase [Alphaproteobacteria bacterium]MDA8009130.1 branched-chain amino acid aminotransferase [Alphaproteobacteria bacterium]MDA8030301.1 branched-chain amino acid aminotransferase [Alphaproteobacteria bacterium]
MIPFDNRDGTIWLNGQFIPWRDAKTHTIAHGLHYASLVFEGERAYNGRIFRLQEHHERLHRSAEILDFQIPYSVQELNDVARELLKRQDLKDAYIRPAAWRGSGQMGVSAHNAGVNTVIAAWQWPSYFSPELLEKGISLKISQWRRPAPDTAPVHSKAAGLYMICTLAKHHAEAHGFTDALMLDWRGYLAEATGANIFLVINGKLHTPIPDCFLDGITRRTVIGLARLQGREVVEERLAPDDLARASEVFICGTAAEVTPVGKIDDYNFTPGEVTRALAEAYSREVRLPEQEQALFGQNLYGVAA